MTCDAAAKLIPLYGYGDLPPDEEDRLEQHLDECAGCAREVRRQRSLAAALDERSLQPSAALLEDCRAELMAAVRQGEPRAGRAHGSWALLWQAVNESLTGLGRVRQPVGAVALVAIGFFASHFAGIVPGGVSTLSMAPSDNVFSTVRSVDPDSAGHVRIAFDETRRRVVSGNMDDQAIQRLLLAATREDNASVRVESVDALKNHAASSEVRDALLNALSHDPNAGVRLKAVEGLKALAGDPDVRRTLAQSLLTDDNPAVRMQVVDLLVTHRDDAVVGVLQGLMQREDNTYVRLKCEQALKEMNASIGTF
jgi:anti-sigma factor RsiW